MPQYLLFPPPNSAEIDQKIEEIMKQSGILTLNGQVNVCIAAVVVCLTFPSFCVHGDKGIVLLCACYCGCAHVTMFLL